MLLKKLLFFFTCHREKMLWTIILFLAVQTNTAIEIIQVTPNQMGSIYPRKTGNAKLFCRNRVIEYTIEIGDIRTTKDNIKIGMELLSKTCEKTEFNIMCQNIANEIKLLTHTIDNKHKIIESANIMMHNHRRKRNLDEIPDIITKTITLSDYSYSDLKQNLEEMRSLYGFIEKASNRRLTHIDYINFNSLSTLVILKVKKQIAFLKQILDITLNPTNNKLSDLISLDILKTEFEVIQKAAIKEHCHLPVNYMKLIEIAKYLKICSTKVGILGNHLYITLKIPTFYRVIYELIKPIPIPFSRLNASYTIAPNSPYYLNYLDRETNSTYSIPLSLEDKLNCTTITDYITCFPRTSSRVIEVVKSAENILISVCNIEQLETQAKWTVFSTECSIKPIPHINQLTYLSGNMYYLHLVRPTTLRIKCFENSFEKTVNNSVLIKNMRKDCFIHYDDGWFTRLQEQKMRTVYQSSNQYTPYSFLEQNLIQKDLMIIDSFTPIRNLQSDFGDLQEQMKSYNNRPKIVTNILKSDELIIIVIIMTTLILCTWILMAYYAYQFKKQYPIWKDHISSGKNLSMTTINEIPPPNLDYNFQFDYPSLPRKMKSASSKTIPKSPVDSYDTPKSTPIQLNTPTQSTYMNENIPIEPLVLYTQINKRTQSSDPRTPV